jgi:hypothetical protein
VQLVDETREVRTVKVTARQRERKESGYEEWLKYLLKSCKSREKANHLKPCTLTLEELVVQYHKQNGLCGICGLQLEWKQESLMSISIDRIDNSLGYHAANIHLVAKWLNIGRGTAPLDEIRSIVQRISQMEQIHSENSAKHEHK